jgi:hypothetical protein
MMPPRFVLSHYLEIVSHDTLILYKSVEFVTSHIRDAVQSLDEKKSVAVMAAQLLWRKSAAP